MKKILFMVFAALLMSQIAFAEETVVDKVEKEANDVKRGLQKGRASDRRCAKNRKI